MTYLDVTGLYLEDLPAQFDCDVIVKQASLLKMAEDGLPLDGFIDNKAGNGREKWDRIGTRNVLFQAQGNTSDRFLRMGWEVVAVRGRPLMPDTSGKGRRVDHVASFEAAWLLASPPPFGSGGPPEPD